MSGYRVTRLTRRDRLACWLGNTALRLGTKEYRAFLDKVYMRGMEGLYDDVYDELAALTPGGSLPESIGLRRSRPYLNEEPS
jgi:hypothetical protein